MQNQHQIFHRSMVEDDATSLFGFYEHEHIRAKLIQLLTSECESIEELAEMQLKKLCIGSLQTPKQCKKLYLHQLRVLLKRIHRTTNEAEGGHFFRQDIDQLQLDVQQVLNAGVANIDHVEFRRLKPEQKQLHF